MPLTPTDLDALIMEPGFSTADTVSRLAGRGVGMDVVASEVRQLGGAFGVNLLAVVLEWRAAATGAANAARPFHECFAIVTLAFALAIVPAWFIRKHGR